MECNFIDYPQKCIVCGNLKTVPYTWNSTVPPMMCTCPKSPGLAWECPRCHKMNAPWKGSCDCTPPGLNWAPASTADYNGVVNPFNSYFPDPFAPKSPNI